MFILAKPGPKKLETVFSAKNGYFCYKNCTKVYIFSVSFLETLSSFRNWYLSEFATLYYMPKGPKNGFKKPKNEEIN